MVRRAGLTALGVAGVVLLGWALAALRLDARGSSSVPAARASAIVVLGCRVEETGEPSPCLAARTDAAVALWRRGVAPLIAFTGDTRVQMITRSCFGSPEATP